MSNICSNNQCKSFNICIIKNLKSVFPNCNCSQCPSEIWNNCHNINNRIPSKIGLHCKHLIIQQENNQIYCKYGEGSDTCLLKCLECMDISKTNIFFNNFNSK